MQKIPHVILADDDLDDRYFFETAIKKIAVPVKLTMVEDGEQLIEFLAGNADHPPDILFLDLNMPRKNGAECLAQIKAHEKLKNIPVVIYSTSLQEETANAMYEGGAHFYLQKPDFTELPKALQKVISQIMSNPVRPSREQFIVNTLVS